MMFNRPCKLTIWEVVRLEGSIVMALMPVVPEFREAWWQQLAEQEKQSVMDLPNLDPMIFKQCTGITVSK